jgi:ribokinase
MKKEPQVVVVGSANIDRFFRTFHLPAPGETVSAFSYARSFGGKGANQAVAAAKLGAVPVMICRVGGDSSGEDLLGNFMQAGVDTGYIIRDPMNTSGMAFITVDDTGENTIVIFSGANSNLSEADVETAAELIEKSDVAVCQLEIPLPTVKRVGEICRDAGTLFILNPAPVPQEDISDILRFADVLCPNQMESQVLAGTKIEGTDDAEHAARRLMDIGARAVVITLGASGAFLAEGDRMAHVPGYTVKVRDTTGAGDAFVGALAFSLGSGEEMIKAVDFANAAAALSVMKDGTQEGLPARTEVEKLMRKGD